MAELKAIHFSELNPDDLALTLSVRLWRWSRRAVTLGDLHRYLSRSLSVGDFNDRLMWAEDKMETSMLSYV